MISTMTESRMDDCTELKEGRLGRMLPEESLMCGTTQTQTVGPPQTCEQTEAVTSRKKNALLTLKHKAKRLVDRICKTTVELKPYELDSSVDIMSVGNV